MESGNKTFTDDLLGVCLALKENIMKSLNVADLVVIRSIEENIANCDCIDNKLEIECLIPQDLACEVGDVCLVIYTNTDFKSNLKRIQNNQEPIQNILKGFSENHSKSFGIINRIIFTTREIDEYYHGEVE